MRGISLLAAALLMLGAAPALAEEHDEDEERVLAAVDRFMAGFNGKDASAMSAMVIEGATVTVIEEREGDDRMRIASLDELIASISSSPSDLQEPIWGMVAMQEGPVATVLARFEFLIDGMRSHCGTNIFNLVRVDGEWKIAGIAYSHIEEGCLEAPEE